MDSPLLLPSIFLTFASCLRAEAQPAVPPESQIELCGPSVPFVVQTHRSLCVFDNCTDEWMDGWMGVWIPGPRAHQLLHLPTQLRQLGSPSFMSSPHEPPLPTPHDLSELFVASIPASEARAELMHLFPFSLGHSRVPCWRPGLFSSTRLRGWSSCDSLISLRLPTVFATEKISPEAIYAPVMENSPGHILYVARVISIRTVSVPKTALSCYCQGRECLLHLPVQTSLCTPEFILWILKQLQFE